MDTPMIHTGPDGAARFGKVPESLRNDHADVLYVTDRVPVTDAQGRFGYSMERSPGAAFGSCRVRFGPDLDWPQLVAASTSGKRTRRVTLEVTRIDELARATNMPVRFIRKGDDVVQDPDDVASLNRQVEVARKGVRERLAAVPDKDIYLYVHGVANTFEDSALVMAELWHFMGRKGVPMVFSWPAGRGGVTGYLYDRESGEFAVRHLKNTIRILAEMPEVERIHILAHSRGTDVTLTALRELFLPMKESGKDYRRLKLQNLVLAAADIDLQVAQQRVVAEEMFRLPHRFTIYSNTKDRAIGVADWLFDSIGRLGQFVIGNLGNRSQHFTRVVTTIHVVQVDVDNGLLGHGYFHNNPHVASDLIRLLADDADPGAQNGRPLKPLGEGFWLLEQHHNRSAGP